jgi:hypothetical protein
VLTLSGKEPGYEYRFVNDTADRVQRFLDAGWEMVSAEDVRIGDKRVNSPAPEGTKAQVASVGQGMKAYVLRIKKNGMKKIKLLNKLKLMRLKIPLVLKLLMVLMESSKSRANKFKCH